MRITDEQITELEKATDIKLLDYQKEMLKRLLLPQDRIFIMPQHRSGYRHILLLLARLNGIIKLRNKKRD